MYSILKITDGTTTVNLLDTKRGFLLSSWEPSIAPPKNGGVWQSSPLTDGRRMALKNFDNAVDTLELVVSGEDQDTVISEIQKLITLLEKAVSYWTADWQNQPVWIEARGARETNTRYAVIKGYTLGGLNNPFSQPFFGECVSVMKELTLVIERDHWLENEPGTGTCVNLSALQTIPDPDASSTIHSHEAQSEDDCSVEYYIEGWPGYSYSIVANNVVGNWDDLTKYEVGLRFPNVTVPPDAIITNAYIEVTEASSVAGDDDERLFFWMYGEAVDDATVWNGLADYLHRRDNHQTMAKVYCESPAGSWHTPGTLHNLTGLAPVVQEIVDRGGWHSGHAMAIFVSSIYYVGESSRRTFYSLDTIGAPGDEPKLYIEYVTGTKDLGRTSTCTGGVFVSNKQSKAQITNAICDDDGVYTDILTTHDILPNSFTVFDSAVFMIDASKPNSGPFDSVFLNINFIIPDADSVIVWQYPTVAGPPITWAPLNITAGDDQFRTLGEQIVAWEQPSDWVQATVNGITGWCVRAHVSVQGSDPRGPNIVTGSDIYTINTPYVTAAAADVPGEIPALARVRILGLNPNIISWKDDFVAIGLRSLSRGENFSPYINMASSQNPDGITVDSGDFVANPYAPAGEYVSFSNSSINPSFQTAATITFDSEISKQYRGTYHAYLRWSISSAASPGEQIYLARIDIRSSAGSDWFYSKETGNIYNGDYATIADLGIVNFGSMMNVSPSDMISTAQILVRYKSLVSDVTTVKIYDLILFPVDEWSGIYTTTPTFTSEDQLYRGYLLELDAIGVPRTQRAILRSSSSVDYVSDPQYFSSEWLRQTRGGPILQANADQRLWFLTAARQNNHTEDYWFPRFASKYALRIHRNSRYLTMRGTG